MEGSEWKLVMGASGGCGMEIDDRGHCINVE